MTDVLAVNTWVKITDSTAALSPYCAGRAAGHVGQIYKAGLARGGVRFYRVWIRLPPGVARPYGFDQPVIIAGQHLKETEAPAWAEK